jgi:hypothetical protein
MAMLFFKTLFVRTVACETVERRQTDCPDKQIISMYDGIFTDKQCK